MNRFAAPAGEPLVVADVDAEPRSFESGSPWLLTASYIDEFVACGLFVGSRAIEITPSGVVGEIYGTGFMRSVSGSPA